MSKLTVEEEAAMLLRSKELVALRELHDLMAAQSPALYKLWEAGRIQWEDALWIWTGRKWDGRRIRQVLEHVRGKPCRSM